MNASFYWHQYATPLAPVPIAITQTLGPLEGPGLVLVRGRRSDRPITKKEKGYRHEHLLRTDRLLDGLRTRARGGNLLRFRAGVAFLRVLPQTSAVRTSLEAAKRALVQSSLIPSTETATFCDGREGSCDLGK